MPMRSAIVTSIVLFSSSYARADVFKCFFTEPWIITYFDTDTALLTVHNDGEHVADKKIKNLSLDLFRNGIFEIRDIAGRTVQHIEMNFKGSDGQSDTVYPYDVLWVSENLRGGCTSSHLAASDRN